MKDCSAAEEVVVELMKKDDEQQQRQMKQPLEELVMTLEIEYWQPEVVGEYWVMRRSADLVGSEKRCHSWRQDVDGGWDRMR